MRDTLVTGGNGFLGSYVINELQKNPRNNVTILSNIRTVNKLINEKTFFLIADIRNEKEIINKVKNFDVVYHLAGNIVTKTTNKSKLHFDINSKGTLNLLKACNKQNIKRFVFTSTCEVYETKLKENIREDEKKDPDNDYGKSKLLAEEYCRQYSDHIKITVIRPSYIYGYGQHISRLFPRLIEQAIKNEKIELKPSPGRYDFVYVKDVAKAIVLLGERKQKNNFEDFNISSGKYTKIKEIFDIVKEITGIDYCISDYSYSEQKYSLNIEKAKKIGYTPRYDLKKGIKDFIKIYETTLYKE